jgi:hypothetical protein
MYFYIVYTFQLFPSQKKLKKFLSTIALTGESLRTQRLSGEQKNPFKGMIQATPFRGGP